MLVVISSRVIEATMNILSSGKIIANLNIDWTRENTFRYMLIPIFNRIKTFRCIFKRIDSFAEILSKKIEECILRIMFEKIVYLFETMINVQFYIFRNLVIIFSDPVCLTNQCNEKITILSIE